MNDVRLIWNKEMGTNASGEPRLRSNYRIGLAFGSENPIRMYADLPKRGYPYLWLTLPKEHVCIGWRSIVRRPAPQRKRWAGVS